MFNLCPRDCGCGRVTRDPRLIVTYHRFFPASIFSNGPVNLEPIPMRHLCDLLPYYIQLFLMDSHPFPIALRRLVGHSHVRHDAWSSTFTL